MPFISMLLLFIFVLTLSLYTIACVWRYITTKQLVHLKKMGIVWILPCALVVLAIYAHYPITKERIIGVYQIDTSFYPGLNANWQKEHFHFEITKDDQFLFYEKLKDGSYKTIRARVEWYRDSPPILFRIALIEEHPLIDQYPALYRGNREFYYVFQSKFGNMFYRKVK